MKISKIVRLVVGSLIPIGVERKAGHCRGNIETASTTKLWVRGVGVVASSRWFESGSTTYTLKVRGGEIVAMTRCDYLSIGFEPTDGGTYSKSYIALSESSDGLDTWEPSLFNRRFGDLRIKVVRGADVEAYVRAKNDGKKSPYERLIDIAESGAKAN